MSHRVFAGSFAGLEQRLIDAVVDQKQDHPLNPVAVLVGSNIVATYLLRRMARKGRTIANLRFFTFLDLARALGAPRPGEAKKQPMPNLGLSRILDSVLDAGVPSIFGRVSELPGFRHALLDTFRDLRDADISPSMLETYGGKINKLSPARREHFEALTQIFGRFREAATRLWDVDDDFRRAILTADQAPGVLGTDRLLVYGIYDVTGQQEELLKCLADSLELSYFIPYVHEEATGFAREFLQTRLNELSAEILQSDPPPPADALGKLRTRIFASVTAEPTSGKKRRALESDGTFTLLSVPGASRVAVEIAREILQALHDRVIDGFHEVGIILRNHQDDAPIITEAFRLRKIPYYLHGGSPFARRPIAQAVRAIANLEEETFSRGAILRTMELICAALPPQPAASWNAPRWRVLTNEARFLSGVTSWDSATATLVREASRDLRRAGGETGREDDERGPTLAHARNRWQAAQDLATAWKALRRASADWPELLDWRQWAGFLDDRLRHLLEDSEDWEAFSSVLDSLSCLGSVGGKSSEERSISRAQVKRTLFRAMADQRYREGRFQRSGVNLLSVSAARGLSFPLVIIPGLEEGRFPSRLRQDPLLLDSERQSLGNPSRLALKSLRSEEEKLLFYSALGAAEKRLVLIASRLDETADRERIPSVFFLRAAAAARGGTVGLRDLTAGSIPGFRSVGLDYPMPARHLVAVDEGEIRLRIIMEYPDLRYIAREAVSRAESQIMSGPLAFDRARWKRELTEYDGRFSDSHITGWIAGKLGPAAGPVSASRIEEYAKCPYLFYLKRVIHLEPWEDLAPVHGLNPLERGRVIHEILEAFLKTHPGPAIKNASIEHLEPELMEQAGALLDQARPTGLADLLWEIEKDGLLKILSRWLAFERERASDGFIPTFMERVFGRFSGEESFPSFVMPAGRYAFDFRGRIDRIDVSDDGERARVVDYKSGRLPQTMSGRKRTPLMGGERIQIAIYRGALSVLEDLKEIESVEGEFLHLQPGSGTIAPCGFTDIELQAALRRLPRILELVGDGIEGGVFFAKTGGTVSGRSHCDYCDYVSICGKDRLQREETKSKDPRVLAHRQMRLIDDGGEDEA